MGATKRRPDFARFTLAEELAVKRIIERAIQMYNGIHESVSPIDLRMDLSAVHSRCPLRLEDLAKALDSSTKCI